MPNDVSAFSAADGLPSAHLASAMEVALENAEARLGATAPNPAVGCVLLDANGAVLVVAAHERAGTPHAEALALSQLRAAGGMDRLHTAVVTLEPCSHHGRTPPCSAALIESPVRQIWIGALDPHPRAPGRGMTQLETAGRGVFRFSDLRHRQAQDFAARAERLIRPFAIWSGCGRPFVRIKTALTATGEMIPPPGEKTFTSQSSLRYAHLLRRQADAILTGSGCILADDPHFTVRHVVDHPQPRRILAILDRRGRVPESYVSAARNRGLNPRRYLDLGSALEDLAACDVLSVLVEAGPTLRGAILETHLWDEEVVIQKAPDSHRSGPDQPDSLRIRQRSHDEPEADLTSPAVFEEI